ncbi:MAG: hypothetical protein J1E98_01290 [Lachnospiraceae bacterium]|nr:hypothetical protein [Lachnospiraceae bacterium]
MKNTNIQWHPGFVAAMNLELKQNRADLIFEKEYNLNTKPLEIDLLVIKKNTDIRIDNEIGHIFREHNILEYKSPEDHMDIDTFYKVGAYASLYKSYGNTVDSIKVEDITISLVRENKPDGLFRYFEKNRYLVSNPYNGIYYIDGNVLFPTQIVVTKELDKSAHIWLGALSNKLKKQNMLELLENIKRLTGKIDKELADSVLEVSVGANKQVIEELIGDDNMYQSLMEIMEPKLLIREKEAIKEGIKEGLKKGIRVTVDILRDMGRQDDEIKTILTEKYEISAEEATEYL